MRGGTQARLVEGADGRFYVAKFAGNPQGNRTLINEWITQFILSHLGISTPPLRILRLPEQLRNEDLYFSVGNRRIPVEGEWHLGSLCPVNPETHVIFDFLPVKFLQNVSNLDDFARVFVADRWLSQRDQRQAVFVRNGRSMEGKSKFQAHFIDHGQTFSGSSWQLRETHLHGLYGDCAVYSLIDMPSICDQVVSQIENLTMAQLLFPLNSLPSNWLPSGDVRKLQQLLDNLHRNRSKLRRTVMTQITSLGFRQPTPNTQAAIERKRMGSAGYINKRASVAN
jgi:hypothetical protein